MVGGPEPGQVVHVVRAVATGNTSPRNARRTHRSGTTRGVPHKCGKEILTIFNSWGYRRA
jgi:hypothetical protein